MRNQVGLPASAGERARLGEAGPARTSRLAVGPKLRMIDRLTGVWLQGGSAGLGRVRAEKDVDASDWFFRAHFFQDPVQPGSLGLEAMLQALRALLLEQGGAARFELLDRPMTWKYRGQVVPENRVVTIDLEVTEAGEDARGRFAIAAGSLWVDGTRIYQVHGLGVRIRPAP
jgi:3-hydroxymyristoyl/3-hydroxydecanoyl-(acyl carrier protein) dehydratase